MKNRVSCNINIIINDDGPTDSPDSSAVTLTVPG